jgi:hypothetical protein
MAIVTYVDGAEHIVDDSEILYDKSGQKRTQVFTGTLSGYGIECGYSERYISWKIHPVRWQEFAPYTLKAIINRTDADVMDIDWEWNLECDIPVAEGTFIFDGNIEYAHIGPKSLSDRAEPISRELRYRTDFGVEAVME